MYREFCKGLCVVALSALTFSACNSDEDLYDESFAEKQAKEQFAKNFIKKFGEIGSDQSWDFAGSPVAYLDGAFSRAEVPAQKVTMKPSIDYPFYDADGYYELPAATYTDLERIEENKNNSDLGLSYAMTAPDNSFTIIPIRQGYTNSSWEMHMVVGSGADAVDYLLFKKNGGFIQHKTSLTGNWINTGNGYTYNKKAIRSRAYSFDKIPQDTPMYFYAVRPDGTYPSSLEGYVIDFTNIVTVPQDLVDAGKTVRIIGVEGRYNNNGESDFDYEDIMFMIVGDPKLPEDVTPDPESPEKTLSFKQDVSKRYMIEDLGNTDDTDYNDIVVDVKATRTVSYKLDSKGQASDKVFGPWENQQATLRHLGGMLDFQLTIGDRTLEWMKGEIGTNPDKAFTITGWNPEKNNIKVSVKQNGGKGVNSIDFPQDGAVPLIIATSTEQPWMEERVSIIDDLKKFILTPLED